MEGSTSVSGLRSSKRGAHQRDRVSQLMLHHSTREPQHPIAELGESAVTPRVSAVLRGRRVVATVDFDDELLRWCQEVNDVGPNHNLAAKQHPEPLAPESLEQDVLGEGRSLAHASCAFAEHDGPLGVDRRTTHAISERPAMGAGLRPPRRRPRDTPIAQRCSSAEPIAEPLVRLGVARGVRHWAEPSPQRWARARQRRLHDEPRARSLRAPSSATALCSVTASSRPRSESSGKWLPPAEWPGTRQRTPSTRATSEARSRVRRGWAREARPGEAKESPEARAAFRELQADAPTGEGPIVRRARRLLTPSAARDAEESERKEHVPRAELHTNPLPAPAPADSVLRRPRVEGGDVTLPGAKKREALAPLAIEGGGRSVAGTQRLAAMPRVPEGSPAAALEEAAVAGPAWPRLLVMVLIAAALAGVVAMVVLFWGYVSEVEQRSTATVKTSAPPVTATAIATPLSASPAPSEVAITPSAEEPTAKASATSEPRPSSTARASAVRSGAASAKPTVSAVPSVPRTSPPASSSGEWKPI